MHKFDNKLQLVLSSAVAHIDQEHPFVAVFDLDSTLFNVTQRTQHILFDAAKNEEFSREFPVEAKALAGAVVEHNDWGIKEAVERLGNVSPEARKALVNWWKTHFFANEYLQFDFPYQGAVEFVQKIYSAGAEVVYLTGRDVDRMKLGTLESLKKWEFPIDQERTELILKPHFTIQDTEYKCEAFDRLIREKKKISDQNFWFFENEPVIIEAVEKQHPLVNIVFMDSVHSGRLPSPEHLPSLKMSFHKGHDD